MADGGSKEVRLVNNYTAATIRSLARDIHAHIDVTTLTDDATHKSEGAAGHRFDFTEHETKLFTMRFDTDQAAADFEKLFIPHVERQDLRPLYRREGPLLIIESTDNDTVNFSCRIKNALKAMAETLAEAQINTIGRR